MRNRRSILAMLALVQLVAWVSILRLGDLRLAVVELQLWYLVAWAGFALAVVQCARWGWLGPAAPQPQDRLSLWVIIVAACAFRLCMLLSGPALSDDIYRYVWEGRLMLAGINPYLFAPADPALSWLRDTAIFPYINSPTVPAIYPPLAQLLCAAVAAIMPSVGAMNLLFALAECALLVALLALLRCCGRHPCALLVYAWNPLPIIEFAGSGHLDSAALLLLVWALVARVRGRDMLVAVCLAGAVLIKLYPLLFVPVLLHPRRLRALLVFVGLCVGAYLPFVLSGGTAVFASLGLYVRTWIFNASLFDLAWLLTGDPQTARTVMGIGLVLVYGLIVAWARRDRGCPGPTAVRAVYLIMVAVLLTSPVVHPWYVCWLLPLVALYPRPAWICWSGTVILSYTVLIRYVSAQVWQEQLWVKMAQYLPVYLLLIAGWRWRLRRRRMRG